MFSLIRFSRNKLPAVLAIFAILLLFIAPVISKSLEYRRIDNREEQAEHTSSENSHQMHMMAMSDDSVMDDMDMHGMHTDADTPHISSQSSDTTSGLPMMMHDGGMMDDMACGYCVMLIHLPLMLWVFVAIVWLTFKVSLAPPPPLVIRFFILFFPGIAQPRAPPRCFFLCSSTVI
ncbi:DUF2946 domain-containing protein [Tatumella morbirosei]|uniref:DUF2946 domain-containing protein n=1 Tax=Tatumella morbirosei TaxID=642227 RepID=UPI001FE078FA|nr:DUF2946 domain-containing protein [Tatumella morbirosei]